MWIVKNKNRIIYNSELHHYGVLGMHWDIRKDDDFIGPMPLRKVNDLDDEEFYEGWGLPLVYDDKQYAASVGAHSIQSDVDKDWDHTLSKEYFAKLCDSVNSYTTVQGCKDINSALRFGLDSVDESRRSKTESDIDHLTDFLNHMSTSEDRIVQRMIPSSSLSSLLGVDKVDTRDFDSMAGLIGSRLKDEAFLSTTTFGGARNVSNYGDVRLVIGVPKGSQALFAEPFIDYEGDRGTYEMILNRGSTFQIAGMNGTEQSGVTTLFLNLIGQDGRND